MGYDLLDRLTSWVDASSTRNYGYDANGNRTTLTIGANNYTYTTPATTNRLGSTSGPAPARTFAYNGAGDTTGDGQFTLTYNDRGRLIQAVKGSTTATYTLDGLGQRVKKTGPTSIVTSGTNYFVYDEQGKLLGEYNSSGALIQEYVWLGTMPIAVLRGSTGTPTIFYIYADQIDRPWVITNTANQLRWRWDTSPFGELAANQNPAGLGNFAFNLRFPGQYRDAETGLFYNYFRDYDPQTGRYVQSDPIGLGGGVNTYAYANQNPLSYSDPTGEVFFLLGLPLVGTGASVSALATSLTVLTGLALAPWAIDQLTDPVLMAKPETPDEEARREYQKAVTELKERIKRCRKEEERCKTDEEKKAKAAECRALIRELEELLKRPKKWTGPHGDGRPPPTRGR